MGRCLCEVLLGLIEALRRGLGLERLLELPPQRRRLLPRVHELRCEVLLGLLSLAGGPGGGGGGGGKRFSGGEGGADTARKRQR